MARPRTDTHPVATAARLLDAAETVFAARGFEAARLEDIAAAVGVRRSSLLYHFSNKDVLYEAVVRRAMGALAESLSQSLASEAPFAERLDEVERRYLAFLATRPGFAALLLRELLDGRGPGRGLISDTVVPVLDQLDELFREHGASLHAGVPTRAALLQVASSALVFAAAGPFAHALWAEPPPAPSLAAQVVFDT